MSGRIGEKKHFLSFFGDIERSFISSIFFGSLTIGLSKVLQLILKLYVARIGVGSFGDYYFSTSTFAGLVTLSALGIPMSVTRFVSTLRGSKQSEKIPSLVAAGITLITITSLIAALSIYLFAEPFSHIIDAPHAVVYFRILSIAIVGAGLTLLVRATYLGILKIRAAYSAEAYEIGARFIGTVIGIILLRDGIIGAIAGYAIGTGIGALVNMFLLIQRIPLRRFSPQFSHDLIRYALPVGASEIVTALASITLLSWLRANSGAEQVGLYGAAVAVASLIHIVPQMVFSIFLPVVSERYAQKKSIAALYGKLLTWLTLAVLVPAVTLHAFREPILSLLFGQSYITAQTTLSLLLTAYGLYALLVWPNRQLLDMAGHTKDNLLLTVLRATVCITLLFIWRENATGELLAYAMIAGWSIEAGGSLFFVFRKKLLLSFG
jgi:O-antigen/teichoic acid export membrane protein